MAKKDNNLLLFGGAAAVAGYLWWKSKKPDNTPAPAVTDADATQFTPNVSPVAMPSGGGGGGSTLPWASNTPLLLPPSPPVTVTPSIPAPTYVAPTGLPSTTVQTPYGNVTTSNFSAPTTGPVYQCMLRKGPQGWTQQTCEQRLAAVVAAYQTDVQQYNIAVQALNNFNAQYMPGVETAKAEIAKLQTLIAQAEAQLPTKTAAELPAFQATIAAWKQMVVEIQGRINYVLSEQSRYQAAVTTWKTAMDQHAAEYQALTGLNILSA